MVFYRVVQKLWHFKAYCKDETQIYTFCPPLKNLKIEIFANNSPKNSAGDTLEYDRSGTRRSVYTKIG